MINHPLILLHYFFSDKPAVSCLEFEHWPSPTWWIWALWGSPILWIHITRALGHGSSPRKMVCSILPYMCKQQHVCTAYTLIQYMINQIYNYIYIYNYTGRLYIYIQYTIYIIKSRAQQNLVALNIKSFHLVNKFPVQRHPTPSQAN